jgi:hypothetical protein
MTVMLLLLLQTVLPLLLPLLLHTSGGTTEEVHGRRHILVP